MITLMASIKKSQVYLASQSIQKSEKNRRVGIVSPYDRALHDLAWSYYLFL
jgi:hypothetical protein